jgi:hypothetical protein
VATEQNKGRDVPAHDEYANCKTHDGCARRAHLTEVFGRQKQGIGSVGIHERSADSCKQYQPEKKQHLEPLKVQEHQLNGERMI